MPPHPAPEGPEASRRVDSVPQRGALREGGGRGPEAGPLGHRHRRSQGRRPRMPLSERRDSARSHPIGDPRRTLSVLIPRGYLIGGVAERGAGGRHRVVADLRVASADEPREHHLVLVNTVSNNSDYLCPRVGRHPVALLRCGVHLQVGRDAGPAGGRGRTPRKPVAQARVPARECLASGGDRPHPAVSARGDVLEGPAGYSDPPPRLNVVIVQKVVVVGPPPEPADGPHCSLQGVGVRPTDIDLAEGRVASIPGRSLELRGRHLADVVPEERARNIIPKGVVQTYSPAVFVSARIAWAARSPIAVCEGAPVRPHPGSFNRQVGHANIRRAR
mmetsp:Transcript_66393/g.210091  ORF Transcript_66393/g.210091 Transcript_66393/m.210091 type:complete len:332 (+) Transcript_66393:1104-2099(+)